MKRTLAVLLSLLMLFGCLPVTGFSVSDGAADGNAAAFMRIVHLDCGRKYFSKDWIIALLYEMQKRGSKYGLATLCVGGGMGVSTIVEGIK